MVGMVGREEGGEVVGGRDHLQEGYGGGEGRGGDRGIYFAAREAFAECERKSGGRQ